MVAQQAQATGTLGGTPVPNLLIYVLDRALTGTVVIEDHRHRKSAISFAGGVPVKVKLPEPVALLSEVLVGMQAVDSLSAAATWETAHAQSRLHGDVLIEQGLIEPASVAEALAEQIALKVEWLCGLRPESLYGYYDGQDFLQGYGGSAKPPVEPLAIVWRAVRLSSDPSFVDATLSRLGARDARLHPRSRVARFGFTPRERAVIDVLRAKSQPLPSLVASELLPEAQLKKILYALVITRHLDLGGGGLPVGVGASSGSMASAAPEAVIDPVPTAPTRAVDAAAPPRAPEAPGQDRTRQTANGEAFRKELRERVETIGSQNYYQILGVDPGTSASAIQSAFFQLAKRWHPDRLSPELTDLRDQSVRLFARMSEAHQVLSNDEQRQEYDRLLREGSDTSDDQEIVQKVLRAATAYQKAEVLSRRGNMEEAEKQAAAAVESDPDQAEYLALYADLVSQRRERTKDTNVADLLKMVNGAKEREPENLRVRLFRARVLKRSGDLIGAHREFRSIVEQDAHNVEAAREVRLHDMRRGKSGTDPKATPPRQTSGASKTRTPTKPGVKDKDKDKREGSEIGQLFGKLFKR